MEKAKDMIDDAVNKNSALFIPTGVVDWRAPTGSVGLDRILGGGLPSGRLTQIYGREGVGKTTLLYSTIKEVQLMGKTSVFVSLEGTYDVEFIRQFGVDVDSDTFALFSSENAEDAYNLMIDLIRDSDVNLLAVDSIVAANPRAKEKKFAVKDGDPGPSIGVKSRLLGDFLNRIIVPIDRQQIALVFINQLRTKINIRGASYAEPAGGFALQHYTTLKINMWKESRMGVTSNILVQKGKDWHIKTFHSHMIDIIDCKGIDKEKEIVDMCVELGYIKKAGSWYYYNDFKWHGVQQASEELRGDTPLKEDLMRKIMVNEDVEEATQEDIIKAKEATSDKDLEDEK